MRALLPMRDALAEPELFGRVMPGDSWLGWRSLLIAAMGEKLTDEERVVFETLTGRPQEPGERVEEFWGIIGRRGGKTRAMAVLAVYFGTLIDYSDILSVGERAMVAFMAASQDQAEVAFGYAHGIIHNAPVLKRMIQNETASLLALSNRIDLQIRPASKRTSRGPTYAAVIADEAAFWRSDDSANPDTDILNAVRPGLATTGGPLVVISSPYARRGEVYTTWKRHFGTAGDPLILVAQGASRLLNPTLKQRVVDRAMERDEASARAEYLGQFRTDVEAFLTREAVDAVVSPGVLERKRISGVEYAGFVDPSGGASDSFTLAIAHEEGGKGILDVIREAKPPLSPENVVAEYAALLKSYGVHKVTGDRYAGEWPPEAFRRHEITFEQSAKPKSDLYRDLLPAVNSGNVDLLDHPRLIAQLVGLERRTSRGGRDSIDHAPKAHDDVANAAAGVLVSLVGTQPASAAMFLTSRHRLSRAAG
ncbi:MULTISPECIES: hypothetical protein [unclassified Aureimonas]|uniref:hypothetical protein n=1 Tax=unclassified Aureimonas TaxID=2615206 RepID=UPI0006F74150|nr:MULTISPECIES: hypothetical protein [unclassified Aureimonas]KQT60368.1 hypothetical protein ASG62_06840 [Aureimonas sp. Leaf427]KQT79246.1 hypothetical protein ASG54_09440 [Aureimonas sp. Leaf460]